MMFSLTELELIIIDLKSLKNPLVYSENAKFSYKGKIYFKTINNDQFNRHLTVSSRITKHLSYDLFIG